MNKRLIQVLAVMIPGSLILTGTTSAADTQTQPVGLICTNTWAKAVKPLVDNIEGNVVGLFVFLVVPTLVLAIIGLVFFHWSAMRATLVGFIGTVVLATLLLWFIPEVMASMVPAC